MPKAVSRSRKRKTETPEDHLQSYVLSTRSPSLGTGACYEKAIAQSPQTLEKQLFGSEPDDNCDGLTIDSSKSRCTTADPSPKQQQQHESLADSRLKQDGCQANLTHIVQDKVNDVPVLINHFDSIADEYSQKQLYDDISALNLAIDSLADTVMSIFETEKLRPHHDNRRQTFQAHGPMDALFECVKINRKLTPHTRGYFLDAIIHDTICAEVYRAHFSGKNFWGLRDAALLEKLHEQIAIKSSWRELQKWRTLTAGAAFMLQGNNDTQDIGKFHQNISTKLRTMFVDFNALVHGIRKVQEAANKIFTSPEITTLISAVWKAARSTSRNIQCGILSCRVDIIIGNRGWPHDLDLDVYDSDGADTIWRDIMTVPAVDKETKVLGTYYVGIRTYNGQEKRAVLLKPVLILQNLADTFMKTGQRI